MSSAPRHYTNGRVAKSAAEEACHQGETPRGSRHPRKPQGSRAESGSRWVVEVVEVEVVEVLFRSISFSVVDGKLENCASKVAQIPLSRRAELVPPVRQPALLHSRACLRPA